MATVQMPEYQDNSEKAKREAEAKEVKEIEKDEGGAELRKRPARKRFAETILPKEDRREIADYAIFEIVIPAIKETINNLVVNSLDMLLFGGTRGYSGNRSSNGRTDYARMSSKKSSGKYAQDDYEERSRRRSAKNIDDILFRSYAQADRVYQSLLDIQDEYGQVRVSDLFDEAEITVPDWTYDSYGWDNLPARADIETVRERDESGRMVTKYALVMPRPYRLSRR